ncbi:YHYH protein [Parasediminibacterium sp. JCM 36343]|uniref:YHYH protein n=1 Tax=Parasediminibacterium sp. JCM 36343 TaxID=3374279 RepID=UPI0039788BBB
MMNGQQVNGNFLIGNKDTIVLEQLNGMHCSIAIQSLNCQDQLLARFKVKKLLQYNQDLVQNNAPLPNTNNKELISSNPFYLIILLLIVSLLVSKHLLNTYSRKLRFPVAIGCILLVLCAYAFVKTVKKLPPKNGTSFMDAAFAAYKPAVKTSWDSSSFYVASNGIPNHSMMAGIKSWQQHVPLPQTYTGNNQWSIPLQPVFADEPINTQTNFMRGAIALAVNGVPIFNPLNNRGDDAYLAGELDNWGGHCGGADDYHYHVAPMHLQTSAKLPIAYALDGFAIYGSLEPDGKPMQPLDVCHGHITANGDYHYHGTNTYPYLIAAMKGKVQVDAGKPAPENQVSPQPNAKPVRPPLTPLRGAIIESCQPVGDNGYLLTYILNGKKGTVQYNWNNSSMYNFTYTDVNGHITTTIYQKKKEPKP